MPHPRHRPVRDDPVTVMQVLDVYMDGQQSPAGSLRSLDSGSTEFRYAEDYLDQEGGFPLSLSLPLAPGPAANIDTLRLALGDIRVGNAILAQDTIGIEVHPFRQVFVEDEA